MRETRLIMGMPITAEARGEDARGALDEVFSYFVAVDERFSPFKEESEVSRMDRGEAGEPSGEMREVLALCKKTKEETRGYFDPVRPDGRFDPSGIVKGWAIRNAARLLEARGVAHFYIDAGGDIALAGENGEGAPWSVGIRNPFKKDEIVKVIYPRGKGVATSGSYIRGAHIYNPHAPKELLDEIVSLTVLGPDVLEADRFATAAFAMGREGPAFIARQPGLEAYAIDAGGLAAMSPGFSAYTLP